MLIIKSIILNYDGIMIKPEFSSQKNVIILCDSWYTKQNLVSIVEEYPNLDLIGNARADDDFTLSDEKINGYYIGVRRVLTNLFGSRKVLAYVTTPEKDSCTRRLFFSTIFPEQLQIFCAWQEKASLNQTGSGWFQYIPLFLFMQMEYRNMLLWAENILVFMQLHDAQPQRNRNADNEAFALRRWQICRLQE